MITDFNRMIAALAADQTKPGIWDKINDKLTYDQKANINQPQFDELVAKEVESEAKALADAAARAEWSRLKENKRVRFEQASRLLTNKHSVRVHIVNSPMYPPACYDLKKHVLTLNQNFPATRDDAERLIYDRALIYHECGHVRWTRDHANIREKLMKASPNPKLFMDVSNILEDGRIEWLMSKTWYGSKAYLDTLIAACFEQNKDITTPLAGLVFYVRYGTMIRPEQVKYWQPVLHLIDKGIRCMTTKKAMELADEIVRIMHREGMNPQPMPNNQGGKGPENKHEEWEEGDEEGEGQSGEGQSESPQDGDEGQESEEGQSGEQEGDKNDSEGNLEAPEGQSEGNPFDQKPGGNGAGAVDQDLAEQVQEIAQKALDELREGAEAEIAELKQPMPIEDKPPQPQLYDGEREESEASQVALVLRSIKVERSRRIWQPANKSGKIDTRRIVGIRTGDSFLVRRDEAKGDISVALLIDGSGSMGGGRQRIAGQCARIVNGALQAVGMPSCCVYFADEIKVRSRAEMNNPCHGGTDTAGAMIAARDWLEKQKKSNGKGLMIIITDGCPNSSELCEQVFNDLNDEGAVHVIVFMIGQGGYGEKLEGWSHKHINVENVNNLSGQLEQVLIEAAGML